MKTVVMKLLAATGYEIRSVQDSDVQRRTALLERSRVASVIDVGANQGQFGLRMRAQGFQGTILSVEPYQRAFGILSRLSKNDPDWHVLNYAVGSMPGHAVLNVAGNSVSSSLMPQTDLHRDADPTATVVGLESVQIDTLDNLIRQVSLRPPYWLKIDTQGYESQVLAGAHQALDDVAVIEVELSTAELYKGQQSYLELMHTLSSLGFRPAELVPVLRDQKSGRLLQFDFVGIRETD